ncbi:MAG: hypothetical protein OXD46_14985 [Chloroflexi bacterium]|nr:hypothetical protein [Chloroflexota bacterium]
MSLPNVIAAAVLIAALTIACGSAEETPTREEPAPTARSTAPVAPSQPEATAQPTDSAATEAAEEENQGPQPPPKDELIKFANWDDNSVKLVNWVAAYIIAHGLDRPIRVIDVEDGAYQEPLLANDVDIVIAADGDWAKEQSGAGKLFRLANPSPVDATLAVVIHPSMNQRAPDVVRLLETMTIEAELLTKQAAMIRGGRIGLKENVVGLNLLKREYALWMDWVSENVATLVNQAIEDGKIGHCRQFINYAPDRMGNEGSRYCKDDPTKTSGNT